MIAVKTCGKLYWAGEYAILEPGQLALIKAIPIYMRAEIVFLTATVSIRICLILQWT